MWEYKILVEWESDYGVQDSINTLNEYGKEGWELAQIIKGHIILKRKYKSQELYNTVIQFMKDQDVTCEETIHQMDNVIEAAYDFMTDLFNIVKDDLDLEEDE